MFWDDEGIQWFEDHDWCVDKVCRHLKSKCGCGNYVDAEIKISPTRRVDALGFNSKANTYYVCEIKVKWTDIQKAPLQLREPTKTLKTKHPQAKVIPTLAIPDRLYDEMREYGNWDDIKGMCKDLGIQIWLIKYRGISTVLASSSPKPKTTTLKKPVAKKVTAKATAKRKPAASTKKVAKKPVAKSKTSTVKKKTTSKKK